MADERFTRRRKEEGRDRVSPPRHPREFILTTYAIPSCSRECCLVNAREPSTRRTRTERRSILSRPGAAFAKRLTSDGTFSPIVDRGQRTTTIVSCSLFAVRNTVAKMATGDIRWTKECASDSERGHVSPVQPRTHHHPFVLSSGPRTFMQIRVFSCCKRHAAQIKPILVPLIVALIEEEINTLIGRAIIVLHRSARASRVTVGVGCR